jgi:hypothetical protein
MLFKRKSKEEASLEDGAAELDEPAPEGAALLRDDFGLHQLWYLEVRLKEELARAARADGIFSIACWRLRLLPGESPSSELLRQAAQIIGGRLRIYDICARIDHERFVGILLDADQKDASTVAFRLKGDLQVQITSTGRWQAGVATFPRDGVDGGTLIQTVFRRLDEDARAGAA